MFAATFWLKIMCFIFMYTVALFQVWYAAGNQIFYSLGTGSGTLATMASYNRFKNNVYRFL